MESKRERFRRLSYSRGDRLRREIQLLGSLSDNENYEYSLEDVNALFEPIDEAMKETRALFERNLKK